MVHSRWISFEVDSIEYLDDEARYILDKAWHQAYNLYKLGENSWELSKKDLFDLMRHSDQFTTKSTENELKVQYLFPSAKEGKFMTAMDILKYLQEIVGSTNRLNTYLVSSALREAGFKRAMYSDLKRRVYLYKDWFCLIKEFFNSSLAIQYFI